MREELPQESGLQRRGFWQYPHLYNLDLGGGGRDSCLSGTARGARQDKATRAGGGSLYVYGTSHVHLPNSASGALKNPKHGTLS